LKHELINLAITCHWIDSDWELQEALLEFKYLPGHHDGPVLANAVFEALEKFDITAKLFCITTDNAGNNSTMMRELSKRLEDEKGIVWDAEQHHIACLSHVINLIVTDFMKAIKGFEKGTVVPDDNNSDDGDNQIQIDPKDGITKTVIKLRVICQVC
jgi:hypothetical protein